MTQQMQQSMPAHLRKYMGEGRPTYVPTGAQRQIAQYMQKSMPAHMKQYAGAYLEQNIVQPNLSLTPQRPASNVRPGQHPPTPDKLKRSHSMYGEQFNVPWADTAAQMASSGNAAQNTPVNSPEPPPGPHQAYDFIMNPEQAPKTPWLPSGNNSLLFRIGLVAGGLLVLIVGFSIIKSLLSGPNFTSLYVSVAADQQELVHLSNNALQVEGVSLSTKNQNFAATASASLSSSQNDILTYLSKNGKKVNPALLQQKVSKSVDSRLQTAVEAGTYNQTFQEINQAQLNNYMNDLKIAFQKVTGKNGKALLNNEFQQAQLLNEQLNQPDQ